MFLIKINALKRLRREIKKYSLLFVYILAGTPKLLKLLYMNFAISNRRYKVVNFHPDL